jgi:hypothetical protein
MVNVAKNGIYEAHGKMQHHAKNKELSDGSERVGRMQIIHKIRHFFLIHAVLLDKIVELGLGVLPSHMFAGQIRLVISVLHDFNLVLEKQFLHFA